MPSFQWSLTITFPPERFLVIGVNNTSSTTWLINYRNQRGVSFPFIFDDKSKIFKQYEVGATYGNNPPSYILVDTKGLVRFRSDNRYKQTDSLAVQIQSLLLQ